MKLHVRAGAISLVGSFLFGFGARLNAQRQREQFSQFVQQELYSSAFGKGSREFGWTFTPMPGTDRLLSGVRTTYAVVVVPQEATSIILEANGCYFPRSAYQPNDFQDTKDSTRWGDSRTSRGCGTQSKLFIASIPSSTLEGTNDFWVDKISYQAVGKGKRIVVLVSGKNFSSQIGVLINGVPLIHSIGMAQPLIRDDSKAGNKTLEEFKEEKVRGRIERVDANKIVFSFEMGDDFNGTPTITLIAPGRAVDLNWLTNIHVNGERTSLDAYQKKMFGHGPGPQAFRIDSVEAFHSGNGNLRALIRGAGFIRPAPSATAAPPQRVLFINGSRQNHTAVSSSLIEVSDFQASDEVIRATLVYGDDTVVSQSVPNPTHLRVDKATIVSYEAVSGSSPAVLVVRIEGSGFSEALQTSVGELAVQSATEAILKIKDPDAAVIVTLTDPRTGTSVKTVVTRKTLANEY